MRLLQVASALQGGGGEQIAFRLHQAYQEAGHVSWLAVGRGSGEAREGVLAIPGRWGVSTWGRVVEGAQRRVFGLTQARGATRLSPLFEALAFPRVAWDLWRGNEDYTQPGSRLLLRLVPEQPDVVHLHNLHGRWLRREGFFDLSFLPRLSHEVPTLLAPQDPWLLTGHCAHPLGCERWRTGCGACPDLTLYPATRRDATAYNWRRKRGIYQRSRLYLATPSRWLMSMFEEAEIPWVDRRVIHNGVDPQVFRAGDRSGARLALGIEPERLVVLVVGNYLRTNPWKRFSWVVETAERLAARPKPPAVDIVCVGDEGEPLQWGSVRLLFPGHVRERSILVQYYQAADAFLHPSRADSFPFAVLEAMSAGLPVVATAVGGIPEQVEEDRTGYLLPLGDVEGLAGKLARLLEDPPLRRRLGERGREAVLERFQLAHQAEAYVDYYREMRERAEAGAGMRGCGRVPEVPG